ncbi:MAG: nucleotidyltransferase family protein [Alistipes sp.]|nr:nucleotidyltransferase family protein [Alistipes sp.]
MNRTDDIIIDLLRLYLWGGEARRDQFTDISPAQWKELFNIASRQGILALTYDAVCRLPKECLPPRRIQMSWIYNIDRIEQTYRIQKLAAKNLIELLEPYGIKVMLLKGIGLSFCYRKPEHRECGDIDIWLYGRQKEADEIINGKTGIEIYRNNPHHSTFTLYGVSIENHSTFIDLQARQHRELEAFLQKTAENETRTITLDGKTAYVPSPTFNAVYLLRHMAVHFAAVNIGLRHLADWVLFVSRDGDEVDWATVRKISERQGMTPFVDAVNAIAVDKLGLKADFPHFLGKRDEKIEKRILDDILHPRYRNMRGETFVSDILLRINRRFGNSWKHKLVYRDGFIPMLLNSAVSALRHM